MAGIRCTVRASLFALTVALVGVFAPVAPAPVAAQYNSPGVTDSAGIFIVYYFDMINAGNYRAAYACYSPQLQRNQSYAQFVALFRNLAYEELNVDAVEYRGANTVVYVRLSRFNTDGSEIYYIGSYTVREYGPYLRDMEIVAIDLRQNLP